MKKFALALVATIMCLTFTPTSAATAEGSDERVDYIYWDQGEINTYWSGVYNKINYNMYRPCVNISVLGEGCGDFVPQYTYGEHCKGGSVFSHEHYLKSVYDTKDYLVKWIKKDRGINSCLYLFEI